MSVCMCCTLHHVFVSMIETSYAPKTLSLELLTCKTTNDISALPLKVNYCSQRSILQPNLSFLVKSIEQQSRLSHISFLCMNKMIKFYTYYNLHGTKMLFVVTAR